MTQHFSEQSGSGDINVGDVSGTGIAIGHGAQAIVTIYQTVLRPLPVNLSSLVRPLIEHYTAVFGGRDAELAGLDAFLDDPQHPFGLLVAPTGLGKTALLVHWIARVQQQHPQWRIIFAPVSIRYQTASEQVTLSILALSLAEIHNDLDQFRSYDQSPSNLRALIADYLRRSLPDGVRLLLVLDGIDEATGWQVGPLCAVAPQKGLKIVVAARQRANMTRDDWRQHLSWDTSTVSPLAISQMERPAIEALLRQSDPVLAADPAFVEQFFHVSEGDPLTSNLLIKALNDGSITPDSLTQRPPGLEAFLKDWVETLRKRRQASRPIRELLALCAAAYGPLTSDDLQALAPEVFVEQADIVDAVGDDDVTRFIITVGGGQYTYVFSHQRLREVFLEQIYPPKDRERLQQRLIAYGNAWYADHSQPLPDYLRQFWVLHLKAAGEWEKIRQVLTEIVPSLDGQYHIQPWQTARYTAEGSDAGYLSDLDILWSWAEQQRDLGLALRCALTAASLRSRSGNLTPELLVQLVTVGTPEGRWSATAAIELIAHMPDAWNQAKCMEALLTAGITLPWQRALEIAHIITDERFRAEALETSMTHLPHDLRGNLLQIDRTIAWALGRIAMHLPAAEQASVLAEALQAARAITDEQARAAVLGALAPYLPPNLLAEALQAARTFAGGQSRAAVLGALAPYLPPDLLAEALQAARVIVDERIRAEVLAKLAPHLPPNLLGETLQIARAITDKRFYAKVLRELASHLPLDLLAESLQTARAISIARDRAEALEGLAPHLPAVEQASVLAEALQAARAIPNDAISASVGDRAKALTGIALHLPATEQDSVLAEALQATRAITTESFRANALKRLAPHLPSGLLTEALQVAHTIAEKYYRAEVLARLASRLEKTEWAGILVDTLQAAQTFALQSRAEALEGLVLNLPLDLLGEVLQAARTIASEQFRAEILREFAPRLSHDLLAEALQIARAIANEQFRAKALRELTPHLPSDLLAEALQIARAIDYACFRSEALEGLVLHLPVTERASVLAEALEAARAIGDEQSRAVMLEGLVLHLPASKRASVLANALEAARASANEEFRAGVLTKLALHLPAAEQASILAEALEAARATANEEFRSAALAELAPHLPPNLLADALQAAHAVSDEGSRTYVLVALIPCLPSDLLVKVYQADRPITSSWFHAEVLARLAPHLPATEKASILAEALQAARTITEKYYRAMALIDLALHLEPTEKASILAEALQAAHALAEKRYRAEVLRELAPLLELTERASVLAEALEAARAIANEEFRAEALRDLAMHLEPTERASILAEALQAGRAIVDERFRAEALRKLAPHLSPDMLTEALQAARAIGYARSRAEALEELALHLKPIERASVLAEALKSARAITDEGLSAAVGERAKALVRIAQQLPTIEQASILAEALQLVRPIVDDRSRAWVLECLALALADVRSNDHLFVSILRESARRGRPALLSDLAALTPWIAALAKRAQQPTAFAALASAVVETAKCWP